MVLKGGGEAETPIRNLADIFFDTTLIESINEANWHTTNLFCTIVMRLELLKQMKRKQEAAYVHE